MKRDENMRENPISGIYCIEQLESHKKYIGQSVDIKTRWKNHKNELNRGVHHNDYLQKSWNKYGEELFKFYVLDYCDINELDGKEIYYINLYNTTDRLYGLNLTTGGQFNSKMSDEAREKLKLSLRRCYQNSDLCEVRRRDAFKQWSNPEIKQKILGQNNGMYGKTHNEEAKKKISEANKGKVSPHRDKRAVLCVELNQVFEDSVSACELLGINKVFSTRIREVCEGKRKTFKKYHWKFYLEDNIS